ncbi:MAG: DNA repair exonuclease [Nitrosomonadaceae bacterium]|nr:DNA repair exonuclease [Nitrosomonadaceae bacterium]
MSSTNPTFLASADLHIGHKLYNYAELEADMLDNFRRLCSAAVSRNVEYVVLAGDVFDDNNPRPDSVAAVKEQVDRLAAAGITLVGIAGDHDRPVNHQTWVKLAGIKPVTVCPYFAGVDYYDYSQVTREVFLERLMDVPDRTKVKWLFLHGQVPSLFKFTEAKKKLDFSDWDVFGVFPSLKGVILGDIHEPQDSELRDGGHTAFIGYCGGLSVVDISEIKYTKQFLHYDGTTLTKVPFVQPRKFVRINFTGDHHEMFNAAAVIKQYGTEELKPVFVVEIDDDTPNDALQKLTPLHDIGMVKHKLGKPIRAGESTEETVNIRSELNTGERVVHVLKQACKDRGLIDEQYQLALSIITSDDATAMLDEFKRKSFNQS